MKLGAFLRAGAGLQSHGVVHRAASARLDRRLVARTVAAAPAHSSSVSRGRGRRKAKPSRERQQQHREKNVPKKWEELVSRPENERFDEAFVSLEGGRGGRGEVWRKRQVGQQGKKAERRGRGRTVKNFKYKPGGQQAKQIFLAAESPGEGGRGGSVYVEADERYDNLLHLHQRYHYRAKDGPNANPSTARRAASRAPPPLTVRVPVGTTVISKTSGGGANVATELMTPGQRVLVALGGDGGLGVEEPRSSGRGGRLDEGATATANALDWQKVSHGRQGQRAQVHLVLRVKADIGLVGLPNAGKSTLLSAITMARPDIADYPFTTLVPNLGVIGGSAASWKGNGGGGSSEEEEEGLAGTLAGDWGGDEGADPEPDYSSFLEEPEAFEESPLESAVVADLPGLIGDAHMGKGLGRVFLRHLKRTRVICHLVDLAAASDPLSDYLQIREELRMYNPDYVLEKPHVVSSQSLSLSLSVSVPAVVLTSLEFFLMTVVPGRLHQVRPPRAAGGRPGPRRRAREISGRRERVLLQVRGRCLDARGRGLHQLQDGRGDGRPRQGALRGLPKPRLLKQTRLDCNATSFGRLEPKKKKQRISQQRSRLLDATCTTPFFFLSSKK